MSASVWLLLMWAAFFYVPCATAAVREWRQDQARYQSHPRTGAQR